MKKGISLFLIFFFALLWGCDSRRGSDKVTDTKNSEPAKNNLQLSDTSLNKTDHEEFEIPAEDSSNKNSDSAPGSSELTKVKTSQAPSPKKQDKTKPAAADKFPGFPETVPVANLGNAADSTGYGAVPYAYRIGKFEVTNAEYCKFLNEKAKEDPYQLYDYRMAESFGGINRSGSFGNYSYKTKDEESKKPVGYVTWESCARYANWLSNGGGNADTEKGSYALEGGIQPTVTLPDHAALAQGKAKKWVIASENEWYKAAYYDPKKPGGAGYWNFAMSGGSAPSCNINSNIISVAGAFKVASPYGTYDQNGNLWEYNETRNGNQVGLRGGSFFIDDHEGYLLSQARYEVLSAKWPNYGFRVVALGGNKQADPPASQTPKDLSKPLEKNDESSKVQTEATVPALIIPKSPASRTKAKTFYVSQSDGNDEWNGETSSLKGGSGPWRTLARASVEYLPGDMILLKRGDIWHEELRPRGNGTADKPILIGAYGQGRKPLIDREDYNQDRTGIRLSDQGGFKIIGIEFARCMTGIYADYSNDGEAKKYLWIENCYFHDSLKYQHYEDYPKRKIGLGVCLFSYERDKRIVMSDITVKDCVFRRLASGFWTNSPDNFNKNASYVYNFKNLVFESCLFEEGYQWQQGIRGVDTGVMRNCITHDIGRDFRSFNGVAGSMFFRCKNWLFEDCEWGFVSIGLGSGDGEAFDFEGNCDNMVMRNCLFHDTDGPGFLLCCYASDGHAHSAIVMENCVINGKSKRPIGLPRCSIVNTTDWNESTWRKCRFYLSQGEAVMKVMDPEKDKKTTFIDCRVKDLAGACITAKLEGNLTRSKENADTSWIELKFGKPTDINEFRIKEKQSSSVIRYVIELWDTKNSKWMSCFNGRSIGSDFIAPIVERKTTKARLRVIQTQKGKPQITEFNAYKDPLGEEWNVKRGDDTPNRVGKARSQ